MHNRKDFFSANAPAYSAFRPEYPDSLFDFICSKVSAREHAWDCATGNGQAARALAKYFKKVYATDISAAQLQHAPPAANIDYRVQPAEKTNFPDHHFDLITVAQALHWLYLPDFYNEVARTARHGAWIATWGYSLMTVAPEIDKLIKNFYKQVVGPYWDEARRHVDTSYRNLPFPFREIEAPPFYLQTQWNLEQCQGYLNTWSAVQLFIRQNGYNPTDALMEKLSPLWKEKLCVTFPVFMRMGRIIK